MKHDAGWMLGLLLLGGVPVDAETAAYTNHPLVRSVFDAHFIKVDGSGRVAVPFADALALFERDDLLDEVQGAYARLLPPGETPEFIIHQRASNHWFFVNKHSQTSTIHEVHRVVEPDQSAHLVYYSDGRRFFGDYRSVIDIRVLGDGDGDGDGVASRYEVAVYAYPVNSFSRFFARHLGVVETFFRGKTDEIATLSVEICEHLFRRRQTASLP
jgi:hypothetical protein